MEVSFFLCSLHLTLIITSLQVGNNYNKLTLTVTSLQVGTTYYKLTLTVSSLQVLTCCTNRVKKRVIIVGTDLSARKYDSVERHVVFRHKLMQGNLKKEYKIYDSRFTIDKLCYNPFVPQTTYFKIHEKCTVLFWQLLTNK